MTKHRKGENITCYLMLLPVIIGFLAFTVYPLVWNAQFAFYDYDGVDKIYVGIENFKRIFTVDANYWKSIGNSLIIAYGKLIIEIPLALIVAVLLSRKCKFSGFFRSIYFMPTVIGVSITAVMFSKLFATNGGIVNDLLTYFGLIKEPINWFGHKWTAMSVLMISSIWCNFGINVLLFMSGVQGISGDYYEAASIDGASPVRQFFKITIPLLKPVIRNILLLAMTNGVKLMSDVQLLTNGGPAGDTNVVMLYIYNHTFASDNSAQIGYAAAMGIVTSIILCIMSLLYLRVTKNADKVI